MSLEQYGYEEQLDRALTLSDLVVYGLIFMVPIAPFTVFGFVWQEANGMVALAFLIGLVGMLFTALSYAAMSQTFPLAGSVYAYVQRGLHESDGLSRRLAHPPRLHSDSRPALSLPPPLP